MTLNPTNVNVTTVGAGTITTAQALAGVITRTGPVGDFIDTLPATANLLAALAADTPFVVRYLNATTHTATIAAADASTTIAFGAGRLGAVTIATNQQCTILFTPAGSSLTVTLLNRSTMV